VLKKSATFTIVLALMALAIGPFLLWNNYYPRQINILEAEPELYLDAETLIAHVKKAFMVHTGVMFIRNYKSF